MRSLKKALLAGASVIALTVGAPALATTFTFTGAIETGTIATTGTYRVTLGGATGGQSRSTLGGAGGYVLGDINLTAGDSFEVLVGGNGMSGNYAGGGGLSMFRTGAEIAIAGGGGGGISSSYGQGGAGGASIGGSGQGGSVLGVFGGAGGGGIYSDGAGYGGSLADGGKSMSNGAAGDAGYQGGPGGFGGGGGAGFHGGGGGGFTGGDGGYYSASTGGSSYLSGGFMNSVFTAGGATNWAFVSLDLLPAAPSQVALPGGMVLFGSALGGFMVMRRRKRAA